MGSSSVPEQDNAERIEFEEVRDRLAGHQFTNVFVYVGDAVRFDALPSPIANRGITLRSIASSTSSAPSFSTLLTGTLPSTHGVYSFDHRIPESIPTMHDLDGVTTEYVNSIKGDPTASDPTYTIQNRKPLASPFSFGDASSPFVVMERGPGGHAPYDSIGSVDAEHFRKISRLSDREIEVQYREKVQMDKRRFQQRIDELSDRGLLEETLVVYTSDHGELLGEGGLLGHSGPMRPELVYVPTVLVHPSFENAVVTDAAFSHIDLLPTIAHLVDAELQERTVDGRNILRKRPSEPAVSIMKYPYGAETPMAGELFYEGVFDRDGGHVFVRSSRPERLKILAGKLLRSPKRSFMRRRFRAVLASYLQGDSTFGNPGFSRSEAKNMTPQEYGPTTRHQLSDSDRETLRSLGYLE